MGYIYEILNQKEGPAMRDTVICFRTTERLRKALESISEIDRRSLSSVIENVLYEFVKKNIPARAEEEKRRFPRKKVSVPALVMGPDGVVHAGMVNDISLGGLNLSVPNGFYKESDGEPKLSLVFALPQGEKPLTVQFTPRHVRSDSQTNMGLSLVDTDFNSYRTLQNYLVES
jgi:hypothetical protein